MKKGHVKTIIINFAILLVILTAIELCSRMLLRKIYNRSFDSSLFIDNKYGSSTGMKPLAKTTVWGKEFSTDSLGWRAVKSHHTGKKKWLFIGDSVTEGVGVDDTSTFASICLDNFPDFDIQNCSLIGYSMADYLHVLNNTLQSDSNVELVSLFYCLNDVYGPSKSKDLPVMARPGLFGRINSNLQDRCATYKVIKLFFYQNTDRYFQYDLGFYKKNNRQFETTMHGLTLCDSLCKAKNVYFNLVILPYKSQLSSGNYVPQQLVKQYCQTNSIEFSDAAEYLSKQPDFNSFYLFADEIHFSAKGHRALANFLSE